MSDDANLRSARKGYDPVGAGDLSGFLKLLADDIDWRFFVSGIPAAEPSFQGRPTVEEYLISVFGALEVQFFPAEFIADANSVVVLGHEDVRVRRTGTTFDANWPHVFTFAAVSSSDFANIRIPSIGRATDKEALVESQHKVVLNVGLDF